jgi:hypothetical protein
VEASRRDRSVSVLSRTRRAADLFDSPGLFTLRLERSSAMLAATKRLESPAMRPKRARLGPTDRPKRLHRYCSGCTHETEHVPWTADGLGSIPSIRWPTAEPATTGTTTCLNCGQWRAASSEARLPAWSSWPRSRITARHLADAVDSADAADDWVSETRAENEGTPPRREPPRTRRSPRLRRVRAGRA